MKNTLLLLVLMVPLVLFAQDDDGPKPSMLEELPDNEIIIGGPDGANDNGNTTTEFIASNLGATAPTGYSGTTAQSLIDELALNITNGGDGWGATVVVSDNTLAGNGTSGSPLEVDASNINTSDLNNDEGFVTTSNDADADSSNELQTLSKAGNIITLSDGGQSVIDEVNDADASASNELQTIVNTAGTNNLVLSNGGGTVSKRATYHQGKVTATGSSFTLPAAMATSDGAVFSIRGQNLTVSSGTGTYLNVTGTTVTANASLWFPIETGDVLVFLYYK
jgi:hypothetical protein